jgi:hypothetical protein
LLAKADETKSQPKALSIILLLLCWSYVVVVVWPQLLACKFTEASVAAVVASAGRDLRVGLCSRHSSYSLSVVSNVSRLPTSWKFVWTYRL